MKSGAEFYSYTIILIFLCFSQDASFANVCISDYRFGYNTPSCTLKLYKNYNNVQIQRLDRVTKFITGLTIQVLLYYRKKRHHGYL